MSKYGDAIYRDSEPGTTTVVLPAPALERQRADFLRAVWAYVNYWRDLDLSKMTLGKDETELEHRLVGLAFSIMALLDGSGTEDGYAVCPIDIEASEEVGKDVFGHNISGILHELMGRYKEWEEDE